MAIKGFNDENTLAGEPPRDYYYGEVALGGRRKFFKKGDRVLTKMGDDLGYGFRVSTSEPLLRSILRQYPHKRLEIENDAVLPQKMKKYRRKLEAADEFYDFYVENLNIYLPYETEDVRGRESFESKMVSRDNGGNVRHHCDGVKIYSERQGERRSRLMPCNKPCPNAKAFERGVYVDCPHGCKPSGVLKFHLREAWDKGCLSFLLRCNIASASAIHSIPRQLHNFARDYGGISLSKKAGFPSVYTRGLIPMVLTRQEVKVRIPGTRTESTAWVPRLTIASDWINSRDYYLSQQSLQSSFGDRAKLNPQRLEPLFSLPGDRGEGIVWEAEVVETEEVSRPALLPSVQPLTEIEALGRDNFWFPEAIEILKSRVGDDEAKLKATLASVEQAHQWNAYWLGQSVPSERHPVLFDRAQKIANRAIETLGDLSQIELNLLYKSLQGETHANANPKPRT